MGANPKGFSSEQNIFRFEISVGVLVGMHESNSLEHLLDEGVDKVDGIATVPIFLDEVVERGSKRLKDHAVILMMIEGFVVPDDATLMVRVSLVEGLYNRPFRLRRLNVLLHWLNDLHIHQLTFTAYTSSLYLASTTLPKVPVPINRLTLYLCPNFSPILNLK